MVRQDRELIRGAEGRGEPLVPRVHPAPVPAAALCRRPPRPRRAVVAVGDVGTGHARERVDERRGIRSLPDGMADAVGGRQVVESGRLHGGGDEAIDLRAAAIGEQHRLGVRLERQDVARAVVLLVRARALVLSDHVALVVGDGDAADHPDLGPCAHHLAIHEERRIGYRAPAPCPRRGRRDSASPARTPAGREGRRPRAGRCRSGRRAGSSSARRRRGRRPRSGSRRRTAARRRGRPARARGAARERHGVACTGPYRPAAPAVNPEAAPRRPHGGNRSSRRGGLDSRW
jgi:hypothetical protein